MQTKCESTPEEQPDAPEAPAFDITEAGAFRRWGHRRVDIGLLRGPRAAIRAFESGSPEWQAPAMA